jgi:hypothetical protein
LERFEFFVLEKIEVNGWKLKIEREHSKLNLNEGIFPTIAFSHYKEYHGRIVPFDKCIPATARSSNRQMTVSTVMQRALCSSEIQEQNETNPHSEPILTYSQKEQNPLDSSLAYSSTLEMKAMFLRNVSPYRNNTELTNQKIILICFQRICIQNSGALVRERNIPKERPPHVDEVSVNFC